MNSELIFQRVQLIKASMHLNFGLPALLLPVENESGQLKGWHGAQRMDICNAQQLTKATMHLDLALAVLR